MKTLVIAEHDNQQVQPATWNTIAAAAQMGDVTVLVAAKPGSGVAAQVAGASGVTKVLLAEHEAFEHPLAEHLSAQVLTLADGYDAFLAPATTFGKNFLPRVAAKLDVAQLSDVVAIEGEDVFKRPIYAGNAIATVRSLDAKKVLTVRATAFEPVAQEGGSAPVETVDAVEPPGHVRFVSQELTKSERPELTAARVVISGGRGMGSGENFKLLEDIADILGAAVGASRAAVDAGFVPNDYQVGQTGKIVAPELYIAVGISGAIQHLAGMKDSKVIVAINKDEEAPIFQVADYGLVMDLFKALPELKAELEKRAS
jgi:electron transfer flavoprotein alpha subunit